MLRAINVGNLSWAAAAALAFTFWPDVSVPKGAAERLAFAVELALAPAAVALLVVFSCLRLFDTAQAEDPFAGAESQAWKINQRVLQNTVEQAVIFVPALLALSVRLDERLLKVLPIAVSLWCAGRLMFWVGYRRSVVWRAPGFDWTMNTAISLMVLFVHTLF
jgi:hypothetical protein